MRASSSPIEAKPDSRAPDSLFTFVLVKPTHYDDDGYPIQWFRSALPSNTLACMNSLAEDASKREVLGPGVRIEVETYDETNRRVFPSRIIRDLKRRGGRALIGIVGVQSNQFPRAVDIARQFRAAGYQVCLGGFHVSGLPRHAAGASAGDRRGAGARHFDVRRRSRGAPARRSAARRLEQRAEAALQFHGQAAVARSASRRRSCRASMSSAPPAPIRASISAAAAPISARSAPSSTCRGARAASARPTISSRSSAPITRRASTGSSSPTTISPATATGRSCSTG